MFRYLRFLLAVSFCLPVAVLAAGFEPLEIGGSQYHPTKLLARFKDGAEARVNAGMLVEGVGLKITRQYKLVPGLIVLDDADGAAAAAASNEELAARLVQRLDALRNSGLFEYVELNPIMRIQAAPTDAAFIDGRLWGLKNRTFPGFDIDATNAWELTIGSTNLVVAVIDTGIRYTHNDLRNQMWRNPDEIPNNGIDDDGNGYVDDVFGINAITGSGNPDDDHGHGTHVAGTIGAAANDGNPHVGIAWNVRLMALKAFDEDGFGATDDTIECIDYSVAKGVKLSNNSYGGFGFSRAQFDAIAAARAAGALFVAAAGNEANDNDRFPAYPASYQLDNIISVAAIDRRDQLAGFSNYGSTNVHIGAPGVEIFSSTADSDSSYDTWQGTSMACPHVVGAAALVWAYSTNATYFDVRSRILSGAVVIPSLRGRVSTEGRLNARTSVASVPDGLLEIAVTPPNGSDLLVGDTIPVYVTVTDIFAVTNATVLGRVPGLTNGMVFRDNGQLPDLAPNDATYSAWLTIPSVETTFQLLLDISAPGKTNASVVLNYASVIRPPNDRFANAIKLPDQGAVVSMDNRFSTMEPGEPLHAGVPGVNSSIWWSWAPRVTTPVIVDTAGSTFDTVLAVYTGNAIENLIPVASVNDVGTKRQGYVQFTAGAGVTYRIAVASATNVTGTVHLRVEPNGGPDNTPPTVTITFPPNNLVFTNLDGRIRIAGTAADPPPNASGVMEVAVQVNDQIATTAAGTTNWASTNLLEVGWNTITVRAFDRAGNLSAPRTVSVNYRPLLSPNDRFVDAFELTERQGTVTVSTTEATREFNEPAHAGINGGKSVWYKWLAPEDGVLFLSTQGSNFDTLLALYTGSRVDQLTEIASNDDIPGGDRFSEIVTAVKGGTLYRIAVDGFDGDSGTNRLTYAFSSGTTFTLTTSATLGGRVSPPSGSYPRDATLLLQGIPDENFVFQRWETASGQFLSFANPLPLVLKSNTNVVGRFVSRIFSDDFQTQDFSRLPYLPSSNWEIANRIVGTNTIENDWVASSGATAHKGVKSLILVNDFRAGTGSFEYRVSSEPTWDKLQFLVNGAVRAEWSGEVPWSLFTFSVPAGRVQLEWRYSKDATLSGGLDRAFVDNIDLPVAGNAPQISIETMFDGSHAIRLVGEPNQTYVIEASPDLVNWTPVSTNVSNQAGTFLATDPEAGIPPVRFYRAVAR